MNTLSNIHPGEILSLDFLEPLAISPYRLAKDIGVSQIRISQIVRGKRAITPDTAIRLGRYFNTTPQLWLNLQMRYDLEEIRLHSGDAYEHIRPINNHSAFPT